MKSNLLKPRYIDGEDMGAAIVGEWLHVRGCKLLGFLAKWVSPEPRTIVVTDADTVDVSEETWNFANGGFTAADVGGSFTITGTTGGLNDGTFTIASVTDADTVVSVETPGGSDETFAGTETLSLQQVDPAGDFVLETSYDGETVEDGKLIPSGNIGPNAFTMTSAQQAAFPDTDEGTFEFIFDDMPAPWVRWSYDPTTGGGVLRVAFAGKDS